MPAFWNRRSTRCRWSRARLALFAGGDLRISERRVVERHLIGCPNCRETARSLSASLELLHQAGPVEDSGAVSLWPALRAQIRASRHERRPDPILRFAVAAAVVVIAGASLRAMLPREARPPVESARSKVAANRPPLPSGPPPPGEFKTLPVAHETTQLGSSSGRDADPQRSY